MSDKKLKTKLGHILLLSVLLLVFGVALGLVEWAWMTADAETQKGLRQAVAEHALQLAVIVILGGGVACLYQLIEDDRKQDREDQLTRAEQDAAQADLRRETRTDYLRRLGTSYREAKEIRRALSAAGLRRADDSARVPAIFKPQAGSYVREMQRLERVSMLVWNSSKSLVWNSPARVFDWTIRRELWPAFCLC